MTLTRLVIAFSGFVLIQFSTSTYAASGLATRDFNPVLQPIFLPRFRNPGPDNGWTYNHSLFVTNTLQEQAATGENLFIDAENYRYEFDLALRSDAWLFQATVPFITNRRGNLDGLIEDWHEFFGLPEGERPDYPRDQIRLEYSVDGESQFSQNDTTEGIGDIALEIGYYVDPYIGLFAGIELPAGSESEWTGNETIDLALWITGTHELKPHIGTYSLLGISFPGDDGALKGLIEDNIWVIQLGMDYHFNDAVAALVQLDYHSDSIRDSKLKAFRSSLQLQLGLSFGRLISGHRLDLFFSEDIQVESAPDITFGIRLARLL